MRLENTKGEYLQLKILNYQFPEITYDKWDSNWLMMDIKFNHRTKGTWTVKDPCLLTFEIERLSNWLEILHKDYLLATPSLEFVEPYLRFTLLISTRTPRLRVHFALLLHPEWTIGKDREKQLDELYIDFPFQETDLLEASKSLRSQLANFPERAQCSSGRQDTLGIEEYLGISKLRNKCSM